VARGSSASHGHLGAGFGFCPEFLVERLFRVHFELLFRESLNRRALAQLFVRAERDRDSGCAHAGGAADAVPVAFRVVGQVVLSAGRNGVGCDWFLQFSLGKTGMFL
jgi:hypothetical protein